MAEPLEEPLPTPGARPIEKSQASVRISRGDQEGSSIGGSPPTKTEGKMRLSDFGFDSEKEFKPSDALKEAYASQLRILYDRLSQYEAYVKEFGGSLTGDQKTFLKFYRNLGENAAEKMLATAQGWLITHTLIEKEMFLRLAALGREVDLFVRGFPKEKFPSEERLKEFEGLLTKFYENLRGIPHAEKILTGAGLGIIAGGILGGPLGVILTTSGALVTPGALKESLKLIRNGLKQGKFKFSELTLNLGQLSGETQSYLDYLRPKEDQPHLVAFIKNSIVNQLKFYEALGLNPQEVKSFYSWREFIHSEGLPSFDPLVQDLIPLRDRFLRGHLIELLKNKDLQDKWQKLQEQQKNLRIRQLKAVRARILARLKDGLDLELTVLKRELFLVEEELFSLENPEKIQGFEKEAKEEAQKKDFFSGSEEENFINKRIKSLIKEEVGKLVANFEGEISTKSLADLNKEASQLETEAESLEQEVELGVSEILSLKAQVFLEAQQRTLISLMGKTAEEIVEGRASAFSASLSQIERKIKEGLDPQEVERRKAEAQTSTNQITLNIENLQATLKSKKEEVVKKEKSKTNLEATLANLAKEESAEQTSPEEKMERNERLTKLSEEIRSLKELITTLESQIKENEEALTKAKKILETGITEEIFQLQAAAICLRSAGQILGQRLPSKGTKEWLDLLTNEKTEEREGFDKGQLQGYLEFLKLLFDYEHPALPPEGSHALQMTPKQLFEASKALISPEELTLILKEEFGMEKESLAVIFEEVRKKRVSRRVLSELILKIIEKIEYKSLRL